MKENKVIYKGKNIFNYQYKKVTASYVKIYAKKYLIINIKRRELK